jgi:hypothetical protein
MDMQGLWHSVCRQPSPVPHHRGDQAADRPVTTRCAVMIPITGVITTKNESKRPEKGAVQYVLWQPQPALIFLRQENGRCGAVGLRDYPDDGTIVKRIPAQESEPLGE